MPWLWAPPIRGATFNHRLEFWVPEKPLPLERARTSNGFTFTPSRSIEYQNRIRGYFAEKAVNESRAALYPWIGPVALTIHFLMPKLKKHGDRDVPCMGRGTSDLDNLEKQVMDALCAEVRVKRATMKRFAPYVDDSQVVFKVSSKNFWADKVGTLIVMDFYDEPQPTLFTKPAPKAKVSAKKRGTGQPG